MKALEKALSLLLSATLSTTVLAAELRLNGVMTQGSLIRGQTDAVEVYFDEEKLPLAAQGQFVFGIGRDANLQHTLTLVAEDGQRDVHTLQFSQRQYDIQRVEGVAQQYVTPPAAVTERIRQDNKKVRRARAVMSQLLYVFDTPIQPAIGRISGVYGSQRIFNGEPRNPHYGLDIAAPTGSEVIAPLSGVVTLAEDLYYSGLTLIVDHGYGVSSTFMHLSKIDVAVGDSITQQQKIAEIGSTGRVTGPHLDWRINWQQERLDPALLLPDLPLPATENQSVTP